MSQKQYAAFAANIKSWDALRQKKTNFVPGVLQVEKVILLSKADFDKLSEDISPDYPFLQDNRNLLSAEPGGLFRCLMVRAEGQAEHLLISQRRNTLYLGYGNGLCSIIGPAAWRISWESISEPLLQSAKRGLG